MQSVWIVEVFEGTSSISQCEIIGETVLNCEVRT